MMNAGQAVVIGAGIGGMCAARVLADHFARVTIIERDRLPEGAAHRKGVPQSRHPHGLLDRGRRELSVLFPGLDESLRLRGGLDLDTGLELATLNPDGWATRRRTGHPMLFASRLLIESVIRDRIKANPRIEVIEAAEATGLRLGPGDSRRATGVTLRDLASRAERQLDADLVIDCTGRSSRVSGWLSELGFAEIELEVVDGQAGYSTCWYQAPPRERRPSAWWWKGVFLNPSLKPRRDEDNYFALMLPIEGDRFLLTLAAWADRPLPADHESFAALCTGLRSPIIAQALEISNPISPIFHRRGMQNIWRHYEKWSGPAGFIAMGDSACAFNPVYAQGMTSASVCSRILGSLAAEMDPADPSFPAEFFRRQAEFVRHPWELSVARDRQALGQGDASNGVMNDETWQRVMRDGAGVPVIADALFNVINLNRPADSLLTDSEFLAAVNEVLKLPPKPAIDPDEVPPYPPGEIAG